tara:strand:- start:439 stop:606 length:168 start_codon:yes stop_codon:yes gene_type:complete
MIETITLNLKTKKNERREKREKGTNNQEEQEEERKILIPLKMSLCLWYTNWSTSA